MADRAKVLIVEDEDFYSDDYVEQLTEQRYNSRAYDIQIANDLQTADVRLKAVEPDIVLLDLRFPPRHEPEEGLDFLKKIKAFRAEIKVIVVTGERDANVGLAAIECGAYDFVQKHSESHSELAFRVNHAYERLQLERELAHTKDEQFSALGGYPYDRSQMIVGASEEMKALYAQIGQVAPTNATVLILGENGTGKELVARAIHYHSPRRHHPIITVNCSAIPAGLIESELFGYVKGSHSTATSDKKGLFAQADGSTLFLDEIGELPLALQVKLLRALQEGEIRPVGANAPTKIDCRIIGSTNKDLEAAIKDGAFREDLYFRLNVVSLTVPTLRERKSDIALLAKHFLQAKVAQHGKSKFASGLEADTLDFLMNYDWPGNVRELEHVIERAVIFDEDGWISVDDIQTQIANNVLDTAKTLPDLVASYERHLILDALQKHHGVKTRTAAFLGIPEATLRAKMKSLGRPLHPRSSVHAGSSDLVDIKICHVLSAPLLSRRGFRTKWRRC